MHPLRPVRHAIPEKEEIPGGNFFLFWDRVAHWAERVHIRPLRKVALKRAEKWMLDHFERSDGLGAIYPAMLNAIVALRYLGLLAGRSAGHSGGV